MSDARQPSTAFTPWYSAELAAKITATGQAILMPLLTQLRPFLEDTDDR